MPPRGKRILEARGTVDREREYTPVEAIAAPVLPWYER